MLLGSERAWVVHGADGIDDLLWVGCAHQHLAEQLVRVECDRRRQLIDLLPRIVRHRQIGRIESRRA